MLTMFTKRFLLLFIRDLNDPITRLLHAIVENQASDMVGGGEDELCNFKNRAEELLEKKLQVLLKRDGMHTTRIIRKC